MRTDTERLDWLDKHHESLYRVTQIVSRPTTNENQRNENQVEFLGWSVGLRTDEMPTVREAIDAAMDS